MEKVTTNDINPALDDKSISLKAGNVKYLAIQGAGGRGAAYMGAIQALEDLKVFEKEKNGQFSRLKGISGTSAGTITALMLSLGYTPKEINEMVIKDPLFLMTLNEKSQPSRYRGYKSVSSGDAPPEIGFMYPGKSNSRKHLMQAKQSINEDKYTLSNKVLDEFGASKKDKFGAGTIVNSLNKLFIKSVAMGTLKSLKEPVVLENIADELYQEFYEEFKILANEKKHIIEVKKRLDQVNAFLHEKLGLPDSLITAPFDQLEISLGGLFKSWEEDKINGIRNVSAAYAIAAGGLLMIFSALIIFFKNQTLEGNQSPCSSQSKLRKKTLDAWSYTETMSKLIWHSNVPRIPLLTPLLEISISFMELATVRDVKALITAKKGRIDFLKKIDKINTIIDSLQSNDLKSTMKLVGSELIKKLPALLTPLIKLGKEGGILDGARVRFIFARLIYEKIEVSVDQEGKPTFKRRKTRLTDEVIENLDDIFSNHTKIKSLKTIEKKQLSLQKKLEELQNDKFVTLKNIGILMAEIKVLMVSVNPKSIQKFPYINLNTNELEESHANLSLIERALKEAEKKLDRIKQLIDLFKMRKHLEIIERYYTFEEHKKLFDHALVICASNITSGVSAYFNADLTPDFSVVEASSMSMNIPGLWKPMAVDYQPKVGKGRLLDGSTDIGFYKKYYYGWFVDGGIKENIPLFAFNGYSTIKEETTPTKIATRSPEEMAKFSSEFPVGHIIGISNSGGKCNDEKYEGGQVSKDTKEAAQLNDFAFSKVKSFLSVVGNIFGSLFEYGYKLRGFEIQPYKSHILTVDYGFMGALEFSVNLDELMRLEEANYKHTFNFFNESYEYKKDRIVNDVHGLNKKGRKEWKKKWEKERVNHAKVFKKPFFSDPI